MAGVRRDQLSGREAEQHGGVGEVRPVTGIGEPMQTSVARVTPSFAVSADRVGASPV